MTSPLVRVPARREVAAITAPSIASFPLPTVPSLAPTSTLARGDSGRCSRARCNHGLRYCSRIRTRSNRPSRRGRCSRVRCNHSLRHRSGTRTPSNGRIRCSSARRNRGLSCRTTRLSSTCCSTPCRRGSGTITITIGVSVVTDSELDGQ